MTTLQLEKIEETYLSDIKNASDGKGDISNVIALGSYAKFLYEIKDEKDRAMTFYERMVKACDKEVEEYNINRKNNNNKKENTSNNNQMDDPKLNYLSSHCIYLGSYAEFLEETRRDVNRAEDLYQRILTLNPEDSMALGNYAVLLHRIRKNYKEAEKYYELAVNLYPSHATILVKYGNFKKHVKRDYNGAENCYKKALKANPKHPDALGNYAVLLHGTLQRYDDAEKYYQKAIEADESHVNNIGNFVSILFIFIMIYSKSFRKQIIKKTNHNSLHTNTGTVSSRCT